MGKLLRIKNKQLAEIINEGVKLIQRDVVSGFNFERKTETAQLTLVVQYYHNVEEHMSLFINKLQESFSKQFGKCMNYECDRKWGLFRWPMDYVHEPGNRYYAIKGCNEASTPDIETLSIDEMQQRVANEMIVAKDRCYFVTFPAEDGVQARFLIDTIRKYCRKLLIEGGNNPDCLDDFVHVNPLFILRDDCGRVADKTDLERVYMLELSKGNRFIWSLVRLENFDAVMQKLKEFPCGLDAKSEIRYVGKEFFEKY